MAVTITLVHQGANHLRYLVSSTGSGAVPDITSTGAASPDLITDSLAGPIKNMAQAFNNGYGTLAAGAKTQAQARAIWLNDNSGANVGGETVMKAECRIAGRVNTLAGDFKIDANVDGGGHPVLQFGGGAAVVGAWSAYLDVEVPGGVGGS